MPPSLTYPGVYIEEVPSGVRTIVGVATSITALIGAAPIGPVDTATEVDSWAEFERSFGGLWTESRLGFAVRDFFLNGGNRALIIRVYGGDATADTATITKGNLTLAAASPGLWANHLRVRVTHPVTSTIQIAADNLGVPVDDLFDLTIHDASTPTGATEIYHNLTYQAGSSQRIDLVLASQSTLAGWKGDPPSSGHPDPHQDVPDADTDKIWTDDNYSTGVGTAIGDEPALTSAAFVGDQFAVEKRRAFALEQADLFNLLCIPPFGGDDDMASVVDAAVTYCEARRAMLLVDPPSTLDGRHQWHTTATRTLGTRNAQRGPVLPAADAAGPADRGGGGARSRRAVRSPGCSRAPTATAGCGRHRPGRTRQLVGVPRTAGEADRRRERPAQPARHQLPAHASPSPAASCGARRTLDGDDQLASEWKYVPVRRTALFIEESLYRGHAVGGVRAQRRAALGADPAERRRVHARPVPPGRLPGHDARSEAYFVKCDGETTTQNDINLGIVNIVVGFAPLKPAEFVIIKHPADGRPDSTDLGGDERWHSSPSTRQRFDPYKNFKFRVKWDGRYVAGVSKVSALKRTTEVVKHREGGDPSTQPQVARPHRVRRRSRSSAASRTTPSSRSGRTRSGTSAPDLARRSSLKDFRKDMIIEVYNEAGQLAIAYKVYPLLGVGVSGAARPRRQRQRGRDPAHQARERRLGARLRGSGAD